MIDSDRDFVAFIEDQLRRLPDVRTRRMFGGYGLYSGDHFFAIVYEGRIYFRTGENNRGEYEERGMGPFEYNPGQYLRNYYEVPVDVIEDDTALLDWAKKAVDAQIEHTESKTAKNKKKKKKKSKTKRRKT